MTKDTLKHKEARTSAPKKGHSTRKVDTINKMENPLPHIAVSTNVFKQNVLYAFLVPGQIQNHIRTQAHEDENKWLPEILKQWQAIQPQVSDVQRREAGLAETIEVNTIPNAYQAQLSEFAEDLLFKRTFSNFPISFQLVEADKLVVPQRTVNLDYVEELGKSVSHPPTFDELLSMCIFPNRPIAPIQHLELFPNPVHVFSSPNTDVRYLGSSIKHLTPDDLEYAQLGGQPAAAIITFVGYGAPSVNAYRMGKRIILGNGHHRVYALRSLGVTHIPMVIQEVSDPNTFPPEFIGIPSAYLIQHPRPALLKDFFHKDFVLAVNVPKRIKTVKVIVQADQHDIPI